MIYAYIRLWSSAGSETVKVFFQYVKYVLGSRTKNTKWSSFVVDGTSSLSRIQWWVNQIKSGQKAFLEPGKLANGYISCPFLSMVGGWAKRVTLWWISTCSWLVSVLNTVLLGSRARHKFSRILLSLGQYGEVCQNHSSLAWTCWGPFGQDLPSVCV